jgi:hypothetical protein
MQRNKWQFELLDNPWTLAAAPQLIGLAGRSPQ